VIFEVVGQGITSAVTDAEGAAVAQLTGLRAGKGQLVVTAPGDPGREPARTTVLLEVVDSRTAVRLQHLGETRIPAGAPVRLAARLTALDSSSVTPLPGRTVEFTVAGRSVSAVTDGDGVAVATIEDGLPAGTHRLVSRLEGDETVLGPPGSRSWSSRDPYRRC
jgi:hypothetical protein